MSWNCPKPPNWSTYSVGVFLSILVILFSITIYEMTAKPIDDEIHIAYEARPEMELDEEVGTNGETVFYGEQERSSHWPTVMHHFRNNEFYSEGSQRWVSFNDGIDRSRCRCCGSQENLNVHHIVPFHNDPSLECNYRNLVTLCRDHHFHIGHHNNWKNSNPHVCDDCDRMRASTNPMRERR